MARSVEHHAGCVPTALAILVIVAQRLMTVTVTAERAVAATAMIVSRRTRDPLARRDVAEPSTDVTAGQMTGGAAMQEAIAVPTSVDVTLGAGSRVATTGAVPTAETTAGAMTAAAMSVGTAIVHQDAASNVGMTDATVRAVTTAAIAQVVGSSAAMMTVGRDATSNVETIDATVGVATSDGMTAVVGSSAVLTVHQDATSIAGTTGAMTDVEKDVGVALRTVRVSSDGVGRIVPTVGAGSSGGMTTVQDAASIGVTAAMATAGSFVVAATATDVSPEAAGTTVAAPRVMTTVAETLGRQIADVRLAPTGRPTVRRRTAPRVVHVAGSAAWTNRNVATVSGSRSYPRA